MHVGKREFREGVRVEIERVEREREKVEKKCG